MRCPCELAIRAANTSWPVEGDETKEPPWGSWSAAEYAAVPCRQRTDLSRSIVGARLFSTRSLRRRCAEGSTLAPPRLRGVTQRSRNRGKVHGHDELDGCVVRTVSNGRGKPWWLCSLAPFRPRANWNQYCGCSPLALPRVAVLAWVGRDCCRFAREALKESHEPEVSKGQCHLPCLTRGGG